MPHQARAGAERPHHAEAIRRACSEMLGKDVAAEDVSGQRTGAGAGAAVRGVLPGVRRGVVRGVLGPWRGVCGQPISGSAAAAAAATAACTDAGAAPAVPCRSCLR
mmetsp:Transcript_5364/g.16741  ORF Transcript_5364/g.16741 Transcript_5364/m.16741 type:complete len:106 (-) Transcript_5364:1231-1548(-)